MGRLLETSLSSHLLCDDDGTSADDSGGATWDVFALICTADFSNFTHSSPSAHSRRPLIGWRTSRFAHDLIFSSHARSAVSIFFAFIERVLILDHAKFCAVRAKAGDLRHLRELYGQHEPLCSTYLQRVNLCKNMTDEGVPLAYNSCSYSSCNNRCRCHIRHCPYDLVTLWYLCLIDFPPVSNGSNFTALLGDFCKGDNTSKGALPTRKDTKYRKAEQLDPPMYLRPWWYAALCGAPWRGTFRGNGVVDCDHRIVFGR